MVSSIHESERSCICLLEVSIILLLFLRFLNWILELFRQYCMICFSFLLKSTFSKNSRKIIFVPFSFGHCMVNPSSTLRIFDIFKHFLYLMQLIIIKQTGSNVSIFKRRHLDKYKLHHYLYNFHHTRSTIRTFSVCYR